MPDELVSVIMPIYHPDLSDFHKAVKSLVDQTYKNIEIVIVSDGNDSILEDKIKEFNDDRIRLIINPKRLGLTGSLNKGIVESTGSIIARLDSDDISLPDRLEKQKNAMDMNPSLGIVGCNVIMIDAKDRPIGIRTYPLTYDEMRESILSFCPFAHSSVMMRRKIVEEAGLYDEKCAAEDYGLWICIAEKHECINLKESLVMVRNSYASVTGKHVKPILLSMLALKLNGIANNTFPVSSITIISTMGTLIGLFIPRFVITRIVRCLIIIGYFEAETYERIL